MLNENPGVAQLAEAIDLKSIKCEFKSHLPDHLIERLLNRSIIKNQCLIWTGAITKSSGYGKIKYCGRAYDIHRLIGYLVFGQLSRKDEVCHINECESRACIRLAHLYKGDKSSNMIDAYNKGTLYIPGWKSHVKD